MIRSDTLQGNQQVDSIINQIQKNTSMIAGIVEAIANAVVLYPKQKTSEASLTCGARAHTQIQDN